MALDRGWLYRSRSSGCFSVAGASKSPDHSRHQQSHSQPAAARVKDPRGLLQPVMGTDILLLFDPEIPLVELHHFTVARPAALQLGRSPFSPFTGASYPSRPRWHQPQWLAEWRGPPGRAAWHHPGGHGFTTPLPRDSGGAPADPRRKGAHAGRRRYIRKRIRRTGGKGDGETGSTGGGP